MGYLRRTKLASSIPVPYLSDIATPLEVGGFTKENSAYNGFAMTIRRTSDGQPFDVPWSSDGKNWDQGAVDTFTASRAIAATVVAVYGQYGISDFTAATTGEEPSLKYDTDGYPYIAGGSGKRLRSTSTAFKTAKVHIFMVARRDYAKNSLASHPTYCMAMYGSAGNAAARWALGHSAGDGAWLLPKNAAFNQYSYQLAPGECRLGRWTVYDFNANTMTLKASGAQMTPGEASSDITYPTTTQLTLGNDASNANPMLTGGWRTFAFFSAAQAGRDAITAHFINNCPALGCSYLPATVSDGVGLGFTFAPVYDVTWFDEAPADANGITWVNQHGGYPWSVGIANNVTNGKDLVRFELQADDMEQLITSANRCERSASNRSFAPGQTVWMYADYFIPTTFPTQTGSSSDWSLGFQLHYNDDGSASAFTPDAFYMGLKNGVIKFITQRSSSDIQHGTDQTIVKGQWMTLIVKLTWAASRNSNGDKVEIWHGPHGTTLPKVVDNSAGGNYFDPLSTGGYLKQGHYRGESPPFTALSPAVHFVANHKLSTSANAYLANITTQEDLPTHA